MKKLFDYLKSHKKKIIVISILLIMYYFSLPKQLFTSPTSTVVTSVQDELLGAIIAEDGQWRFPEIDTVPVKFKACILEFEDAHFNYHFGFNPVSIVKAFAQNLKAKKVVRGGSTLTQQVIRLSRHLKKRSYFEKLKELVLATRLEFRHSKEEILKLYTSHAPFGGNVVGLEMAAWRYFGLKPKQLSWSESATLAVLPNAPSLIYPGKNQLKLKKKRNRLLKKLWTKKVIDSITYELAIAEELPRKPYKLPTIASHLVQETAKKHKGEFIKSSVDIHVQRNVNRLMQQHYEVQKQNEVFNAAVLVLDVETRKVIAYVGNTPTDVKHQKDVNNIIAPRSTGSTLKPFLYANMLQSGDILPKQLVADIPTEIAGYTPKNFDLKYDGAVPANEALTRSLNIPAVRMLRAYGLEKFKANLEDYNIKNINKTADYYGLSLILGGAEATLWDLCKTFAGYAAIVNNYEILKHKYYEDEFVEPSFIKNDHIEFGSITDEPQLLDAASSYTTLNTLTEVNRPFTDQAWKYYDSSQKIAWKTGTSFGNKDAWAIGATTKYVVGVWVGNSDGEGRPNLTGVSGASPLLFNVFDILPKSEWFLEPYEAQIEEEICKESGYLALPICNSVVERISKNGVRAKPCPNHIEIQLDENQEYRVNTQCESTDNIVTKPWFILPPIQAYFYQFKNPNYQKLPEFRSGCQQLEKNNIDFVYPTKYRSKVSLTKGNNGKRNPIVLKITHTNPDAKIYWYVNTEFKNETKDYHEFAIVLSEGLHTITVIDNFGNEKRCILEVN